MNTADNVDSLIISLRSYGIPLSEQGWQTALACVGWPYVYSAWGDECTPAERRKRYKLTGIQNIENNFHVYGIEWTQEEKSGKDVIRFYVDDIVYSEQVEEVIDDDDYWPFNRPNYFIINLALGGTLGGDIHDDIFNVPVLMKVDWVRVYQRDEVE